MRKKQNRKTLSILPQEPMKSAQFIKELWKRFDKVLHDLENDIDQQLWLDLIKIALSVHNDTYGFYPAIGFTEENVISGYNDWGQANIRHSYNNSAVWFYDGFVISFYNGLVERIDLQPGLGINLN